MKKMLCTVIIAIILYNALLPTLFYRVKATDISQYGSSAIGFNITQSEFTQDVDMSSVLKNSMGTFMDEQREIESTESQSNANTTVANYSCL